MLQASEHIFFLYIQLNYIKSVAYRSQGSHSGQLDFCNWLTDSSTIG